MERSQAAEPCIYCLVNDLDLQKIIVEKEKNMKRFLAMVLILVMCAALVGCASKAPAESAPPADAPADAPTDAPAAEDSISLRLAFVATPGNPHYDACVYFADRVAELSEGKLTIELMGSGVLGDYTATFNEMANGTLEMCWDSVVCDYDRSLELAAAPYLVSNWAQVKEAYTTDSWLGKFIADRYLNLGVRVIGYIPGGFFVVAGNNVGDTSTLFDLDVHQDAICRVPPMNISVLTMEAMNFDTTAIPYGDLYTALQTGVADCWMGGGPSSNYVNFRDVIKYCVCYNYMNEIYPLSISEEVYNTLSPELQEVLIQAGQDATAKAYELCYEAEEGYYKQLEDAGIEVIKSDAETINHIADVVRAASWPSLEEVCGAEVVEELYAFAEEMNKIS